MMTNYDHEANMVRLNRILAIREHTLGITDTCPACEEGRKH